MSRQNDIKKLLLLPNRRLQMLERKCAMDGTDTSDNILIEIDDIKAAIANLQSELETLEKSVIKEPPPEIQRLYYTTKEAISKFRQTLENLSGARASKKV